MSCWPTADVVLDARGYYCPVPVIKTDRAVSGMAAGQVLQLIADDRGVLTDIPDWCAARGHQFLGHSAEGRAYHLYLRKG